MRMHFAEVQGRFDVYDPAVERFIYYTLMEPRGLLDPYGPGYVMKNDVVSLECTLPVERIQEVSPANGDWKFDFEATYYGFGTVESGGTKWTIRNGISAELDREGGIGGGLWVHFGNGNGFRDRELSEISGAVEQNGVSVSGAEVQLLNGDGTVYKAVKSGWDGKYRLEDIAPGTYTLEGYLFESNGELFCDTEEVTVTGSGLNRDLNLVVAYTVSYGLNGGGGTPPPSRRVIGGTEITLPGGKGMTAPPGPPRTAFLRWDDSNSSYSPKGGALYTVNGNVRFTARWGAFTTVDEVKAYLLEFDGEGSSADDPLPLPVNFPSSSEWGNLLTALQDADEYVDLDLSGTDWGTGFNPGNYNASVDGRNKIVSLALPDTATNITNGGQQQSRFKPFPNLQTLTGAKITTLYNFALQTTSLVSVSFPEVITLDEAALEHCYYLKSVSFPKAKSIGGPGSEGWIFADCTALESVYLPVATTFNTHAFAGCTSLKSVSFPAAETIYSEAFLSCTKLESVSLPVATFIGNNAFNGCTKLESASLPAATSIGTNAFNGSQLSWVDLSSVNSIGNNAFANTGGQALTIIMGPTAPTPGSALFSGVAVAKTVTVRIPANATGYDTAWETAFTGGSSYITLILQRY
jgi:hypothetical protein